MTKKVKPKNNVKRLMKSSNPLSLRLLKRSELPPVMICEALSALLLCNNTMAIKRIEIIIKNTSMISLLFLHII